MTDTQHTFLFGGVVVPFEANETIAAALDRAGVLALGEEQNGCAARYFCGIGACQACVVSVDGARVEACLTTARTGQIVEPVGAVQR